MRAVDERDGGWSGQGLVQVLRVALRGRPLPHNEVDDPAAQWGRGARPVPTQQACAVPPVLHGPLHEQTRHLGRASAGVRREHLADHSLLGRRVLVRVPREGRASDGRVKEGEQLHRHAGRLQPPGNLDADDAPVRPAGHDATARRQLVELADDQVTVGLCYLQDGAEAELDGAAQGREGGVLHGEARARLATEGRHERPEGQPGGPGAVDQEVGRRGGGALPAIRPVEGEEPRLRSPASACLWAKHGLSPSFQDYLAQLGDGCNMQEVANAQVDSSAAPQHHQELKSPERIATHGKKIHVNVDKVMVQFERLHEAQRDPPLYGR
mmetsp:Transcript_94592/g.294663  ORF Transcript_94592/g.294663 Transcript_94592/m.294663 type:complete len:325 (-) Transcript_94592:406-1380(-)